MYTEKIENKSFIIIFKEYVNKQSCKDDITISGGVIIDDEVYNKKRMLFVEIEATDKELFLGKFKNTRNYKFSNAK